MVILSRTSARRFPRLAHRGSYSAIAASSTAARSAITLITGHTHPLKPRKHPNYDARIKAWETRLKKLEEQIHKLSHGLQAHSY